MSHAFFQSENGNADDVDYVVHLNVKVVCGCGRKGSRDLKGREEGEEGVGSVKRTP